MSTGYNPIVELAKETGTPLHRWKESTVLIDSEGHLVPSDNANGILKQVWNILEAAMDHSTKYSAIIHSSDSLYDFFKSWCDQECSSERMTRQEMELTLSMSQMWGAYIGDRIERQSLKFYYLEDCIAGGKCTRDLSANEADFLDDCFIPSNYEKIMDRISALPLAQAHIQLNTVMVSVQSSQTVPHSVSVTTSDGKQQCFDDVVITTPLGWLKQHKESIHHIHPRILAAIYSISYGRLEKVIMP